MNFRKKFLDLGVNMKYLIILLISTLAFFVVSCQNESSEKLTGIDEQSEIVLDSNQAMVYTVPTPVQITSAFKLLDISYSEEIIRDTKDSKIPLLTSFSKSLNLGINLVDFAYVSMYDQQQTSLIYINKIENLTKELDLQNKKTVEVLKQCKANINQKDSLFKTLLSFQNEVDRRLFEIQKEEVSILIISGFYIEGLYMLVNNYEKLIKLKELSPFYSNNLNNILLQQKIYIESLIDLMKMYPSNDFKKLSDTFSKIKEFFDTLNIRYEYSDKEKKIKNVTFDNTKIKDLKKMITDIRKSIINNTY